MKDGHSWKGNSYIDTYSSNSLLQYLNDWDYTYSNVALPDNIGTYSLDNTVTIDQRDEIIGNPGDPSGYSEINFGQEKYALGIGLVYRKFFHSEFQPGSGGLFGGEVLVNLLGTDNAGCLHLAGSIAIGFGLGEQGLGLGHSGLGLGHIGHGLRNLPVEFILGDVGLQHRQRADASN